MPSFTAHNIRLDNGELTYPDAGWLIADEPRCLSAKRVIRSIFPDGRNKRRIVDLGCLEGAYAVEFARMGIDSLGIEVRKSNFENCLYVKNNVNLLNLTFANDDVWNLPKYGPFDIVYCNGLLYHLDRPAEFLHILSNECKKALILNTHFATEVNHSNFVLSDLTENEGIPGRWFGEYDPGMNRDELDALKWASWNNSRSFWPLKEYIPQLLQDVGFDLVFEQFDHLGTDIYEGLTRGGYKTQCRAQFVAIKT